MNNWVEVSEPNLTHNLRVLQAAAGAHTEILAVIKANAYGHGVEPCSLILARAGARWLGVTCAAEGARVRHALAAAGLPPASPQAPDILILCGFLPADVPVIREHRLVPVLWTPEQIDWLSDPTSHAPLRVHIEVDTGMGRQGVLPGPALAALLHRIASSNLRLDGLFTHFCSSEQAGSSLTCLQQQRFEAAIHQLRQAQLHQPNLQPAWLHAGNSSSLDNPPPPDAWLPILAASIHARAMVRTGLALYGHTLPISHPQPSANSLPQPHIRPALLPVLHWKAHVLAVRDLAQGETVGYNATFTAPRPMRVALLPVGYADGLRRELSSSQTQTGPSCPGGWAILHGHPAPILGRISMNLTVVDVSAISAASPCDVATVLGPGITAEDHARLAQTIPYEILCGIHPCG